MESVRTSHLLLSPIATGRVRRASCGIISFSRKSAHTLRDPHLPAPPVCPGLSAGGVAHGEGSQVSQNTVLR